jgi:hypothetical protein
MSPIINTMTSGRFGGRGASSGPPNGSIQLEQNTDVLLAENGNYLIIE